MGGMSDDTRGNVGLHCRLKVESVAKYHADEQDTTKAPCGDILDHHQAPVPYRLQFDGSRAGPSQNYYINLCFLSDSLHFLFSFFS